MIRFTPAEVAEAQMAARQVAVKKYVIRLGGEERAELEALIGKGKSAARRLTKARILLKADVSEAGEGWSDSEPWGASAWFNGRADNWSSRAWRRR